MSFRTARRSLRLGKLGLAAAVSAFAVAALTPVAIHAASPTENGVRKYEAGDFGGAIRDWTIAAEANDPNALFNLGQAYRLGRGVKADQGKAAQFYQRAAELGHLSATGNLGTIYYFSDAPLRNRAKALSYWTDAAQRGDSRSQYMLAVLHFNGDVVGRDRSKAYGYALVSAGNGLPEGRETLEQISKYASADEIEAGKQFAASLQKAAPVQVVAALPQALPKPSIARAPALKDGPKAAEQARLVKAKAAETGQIRQQSLPPVAPAVTAETADIAALANIQPAANAPVETVAEAAATVRPTAAAQTAAVPGAWRVQFGAFSDGAAAARQWQSLVARSAAALASLEPLYLKAGGSDVTKLQAGAFADRAPADSLCAQVKSAGGSCFVVRGQ